VRFAGLRLALSLLTVLPVRSSTVDRSVARTAIALAPLVGLLLGGVAAGALSGLDALGAPPLLAGILTVGLLALLTRGMHLDGLADTADGLGSYGPPDRALAVMRDGGAGPFAVIALVVVISAQAVSLAALVSSGRWPAVVLAVAAGRAAFPLCCTKPFPAARPEGLGALVAGSQPALVPVAWWLALAAAAVLAVPGRPWLGPIAVLAAATLVLLLTGHARRRFGGITGDVLGAAGELVVTVVLVICTLGTA
jgi:adenosylcobinamide-GDP ribazoletransferase